MDTIEEFVASLNNEQVKFFSGWLNDWLEQDAIQFIATAADLLDCCETLIDVRGLDVDE